jgi:hypothetical protein
MCFVPRNISPSCSHAKQRYAPRALPLSCQLESPSSAIVSQRRVVVCLRTLAIVKLICGRAKLSKQKVNGSASQQRCTDLVDLFGRETAEPSSGRCLALMGREWP